MNIEFDFNIKLKGKMSLRRFLILVIGGSVFVANLMSANGTVINKIESVKSAVVSSK